MGQSGRPTKSGTRKNLRLQREIPEELVVAPTPAKLGDVVVVVLSVKVSKVALKGLGVPRENPPMPLLIVNLGIGTTNPNRKIDYQTWAGRDISIEREPTSPRFQTTTRIIIKGSVLAFPTIPSEGPIQNSIYPDKPVTKASSFSSCL